MATGLGRCGAPRPFRFVTSSLDAEEVKWRLARRWEQPMGRQGITFGAGFMAGGTGGAANGAAGEGSEGGTRSGRGARGAGLR